MNVMVHILCMLPVMLFLTSDFFFLSNTLESCASFIKKEYMAFFLGFADTPHLQIGMVSGILAYKFGSTFAWITSASVATYIAFTLAITQVQTQYYAVKPISLKIFLWFQLFKSSCDV